MRRYMMAMRDNAVQMRGLRRMLHRIRWAAGVMCFEAGPYTRPLFSST